MGKKKRKLRKAMHKRELDVDDEPALVVCVGKKCCSRDESRAVVEAAREESSSLVAPVRVVPIDCLHVCKNGPIAATFPRIRFKQHVSPARARKMIDKLDERRRSRG